MRSYLEVHPNPRLKIIKKWCIKILKGLQYLHDRKVIHRDIKCDNILVNSETADIKIGDLGLSTSLTASHAESVLGTPEFMAPEFYEENYGTSVDIYAFGMSLIQMLIGETPYRECDNPAQIYKKVTHGKKPQAF